MAHPVHSPSDSSWHIPSAGPLFLQLFVLSQAPHNQEQYENLVLRAAEAIIDINSKPLACNALALFYLPSTTFLGKATNTEKHFLGCST